MNLELRSNEVRSRKVEVLKLEEKTSEVRS